MTAPTTRQVDTSDKDRLKFVCAQYLEVPLTEWKGNTSDLKRALDDAGVERFHGDFIGLSMHDIENLTIPPGPNGGEARKLPPTITRHLLITQSFFHHGSRRMATPVEIKTCSAASFNSYRTSVCDPAKPIAPWNSPGVHEDAISQWRKNARPSKSNFKVFKDPATWGNSRDRFVTTLEAQGLECLIELGHIPNDPALDEAQQAWLCKVMQDAFEEPIAKSVVK